MKVNQAFCKWLGDLNSFPVSNSGEVARARSMKMRLMIWRRAPADHGADADRRHGSGTAVEHGRIHVISGGPTPGSPFSDLNEVFLTLKSLISGGGR